MWRVDCNSDCGKELNMMMMMSSDHSVHGRKLRPLMPRPICSTTMRRSFSTSPTTTCSCCVQNPNGLARNQTLSCVNGYGIKRDMPFVSSRWNPTPEQLQALEEMYRRGTRTPSAEQIQQIAAKLRRFGKIEGKNVFYWFQNHKARERQKKRRQIELLAEKKNRHAENLEIKQSGLITRYKEIEHPKSFPTFSNYTTPSKDSESMHGAVMMLAECKKRDEWTRFDHRELQQKQKKLFETSNWQLDLSSSCITPAKNININSTVKDSGQENSITSNRTLELFPIKSDDSSSSPNFATIIEEDGYIGETKFEPNKFFEFLPTKK